MSAHRTILALVALAAGASVAACDGAANPGRRASGQDLTSTPQEAGQAAAAQDVGPQLDPHIDGGPPGDGGSGAAGDGDPDAAGSPGGDGAAPAPPTPSSTLPGGRKVVVLAPGAGAPAATVTACAKLQGAINARAGGGLVQLEDLTCKGDISIAVSGKGDGAPIVIRSAKRLGTTWSAGTWTISGSFVRVEGIHFTGGASVKLTAPSSRTRITRCRFSAMHTVACKKPYLLSQGALEHRFDHNLVQGGSGYQINYKYPSKYSQLDHNHFTAAGSCAQSTGLSVYLWQEHPKSVQEPFFTVEQNLFDYAGSTGGMIETKCSENWIRHNTFKGSLGGVRLRHGLKSHVYGNFILGGMGISVCGSGHQIFNNYLAGCKEGLRIQAGNVLPGQVPPGQVSVKGSSQSPYEAVRDATIANNTLITTGAGQKGVTIGFVWPMTSPLFDVQSTWFVNNLTYSPGGAGTLWSFEHQSKNSFDDNLYHGAKADDPVSGLTGLDPQLSLGKGLYRPGAGSANVRDQGTAVSFVTDDMDGQPRTIIDIGSDEVSQAPILRGPLTAAQVGPDAP